MTKEEFKKVLDEKSRVAEEAPAIDWEATKCDWLENLAHFYAMVEGYLAEFQNEGKVKLKTSSVTITEEHLGAYEAESRSILIGADKVDLVPIGTLLIGAKGRVDMVGPAGTAKFILTGKHANGVRISVTIRGETKPAQAAPAEPDAPEELVWKLATPPPKIRFFDLEPETFFSALTEVVNG
jgi:hypothetical protein